MEIKINIEELILIHESLKLLHRNRKEPISNQDQERLDELILHIYGKIQDYIFQSKLVIDA